MNTPKTNLMAPNKLTAFNRVKLIAMDSAGVRHSAIARELQVTQQSVCYHVERQKKLTDSFAPADTMTDTMSTLPNPPKEILISSFNKVDGYLWQGKIYKSLDDISDSVTLGDEILTVTVTDRQVVGLVKLEGDTKNV